MKNITEILREQGFEMDDEKAKAVEKAVLESYRTIEELNGKAAKLEAANARIAELEAQSSELTDQLKALDAEKGANADAVSALQAKVAEFEQAEAERAAKAKEAGERAAFDDLFAQALDGRTFSSDLIAEAVSAKAYEMHKQNPAMGVADIIAKVTGDQDVWSNPQRDPKKMPVPSNQGAASGIGLNTIEDIKKLSAKQINENWDAVKEILESQRQ